MQPPMDAITLEGIDLEVIVGILDFERVDPQPLQMDLTLYLDLESCGQTGNLALGVDYASVLDQVRMVAEEGRWWLIESMGIAICTLLLAEPTASETRGSIRGVDLKIRKPTILDGVAVPGLQMSRRASDLSVESMEWSDGVVGERLVQPDRRGAWRVRVSPGATVNLPPDSATLVLAGEFDKGTSGDRVSRGETHLRCSGMQEGLLLVLGRHPS
jgi:7,8-dihydroneopterin aldolase/epimerase/oxygenase